MTSRYIARIYFIILFVISLFETRVFNFVSLNLFLAYIPLELCFLLDLFKPRKKFEWLIFIIFALIFILLVPNTFYMVTDLINLNQFTFLTAKCIFCDLLHGSHICSFISFHFKAMVKSMFINSTYVFKWFRNIYR